MTHPVAKLIDTIIDGTVNFETLSRDLQNLGTESIALDLLSSRHWIYMKDGSCHEHLLGTKCPPVNSKFSKEKILEALDAFDKQESSAVAFFSALAAAGVCYARCNYSRNQAIYLGRSMEFHLEEW